MATLDSLPDVSQGVVEAMQKAAEKKFGKIEEHKPLEMHPEIARELGHQAPAQTVQPKVMAQQLEVPVEVEEVAAEELTESPEVQEIKQAIVQERDLAAEQIRNFRAIKEKADRAERERDEAMKLVRDLAAQRYQPQQPEAPVVQEDFSMGVNADDIVEGKHLTKVGKEIHALKEELKQYKKQSQQQQQQSHLTATEAKLKSQYPDFDAVVSKENLDSFNFTYPELAQSISATSDLYTKAVSAYTLIKKFGVYQDDTFKAEKERAQKNAAKPRPLTSVSPQQGDSALSKANAFANGLTKELQQQMLKEMMESRKGY